jgi:hypothetical protein
MEPESIVFDQSFHPAQEAELAGVNIHPGGSFTKLIVNFANTI